MCDNYRKYTIVKSVTITIYTMSESFKGPLKFYIYVII